MIVHKNAHKKNRLTIKRDAVAKLLKTFDEKFKIIIFTENDQILGKGAFGKCYLGILNNQQTISSLFQDQEMQLSVDKRIDLQDPKIKHNIVVVKQIKKDKRIKSQQDLYKKQIYNLSLATRISGNNPNIVRCYPFTFSSDTSYYMVMQYCQSKSLDRLMNKRTKQGNWFNFIQFLKIFSDIVNGYNPLIKTKIIHEDLKAENIFIKGKNFKIGDFGLSFIMNNKENKFGRGGTQSHNGIQKYTDYINVSHKSDIYAMGIILFRLFYGTHPYFEKHEWDYYKFRQIQRIKSLKGIKNNQNFMFSRYEEIEIFINFYSNVKLKVRKPMVLEPELSGEIKKKYGTLIKVIYTKLPQILHKMIEKDIKDRIAFIEVQSFVKEYKIPQILNYIHQQTHNHQSTNKIDYFNDLNQQGQDQIYLPVQISQFVDTLCMQSQSDIQKSQVQIRTTLLKGSSHDKQKKSMLMKKYPRVIEIKQLVQKINIISRFLMQVYKQFSQFDLSLIFTKHKIQNNSHTQNQKNYYQQKKIQLQFVIQRYLLSFLSHIKSTLQLQIKKFNEPQIELYYRQNVDLLLQIIERNKDFLQSELFISEKDIVDYEKNQEDLKKVICEEFLKDIGLQESNVLLAYYCVTILRIVELITEFIGGKTFQKEKRNQQSIKNEQNNQNQNKKAIDLADLRQEWNQMISPFNLACKNNKTQESLCFSYDRLFKITQVEIKKRSMRCFVFSNQQDDEN